MYNVSEQYKNAIKRLSRQTKVAGTLLLSSGEKIQINDKDILSGTLNIDNACVNGQEFEIGSVYLGQLKMTIDTLINRYNLYGAKIELSYFLKLEDGNFESVPLGIYTIDDAIRNGKYTSITAYDNMSILEKPLLTVTTGTPYSVLKFISKDCGIEIEQTEDEINAMSAKDEAGTIVNIKIMDNNSMETYRDLLSDVASSLGGFATIGRTGKIKIVRFLNKYEEINETHRKDTKIADYKIKYSGIKIKIGNKEYIAGDETGTVYKMDNELWNVGTDKTKQILLENVWNAIKNIEYTPVTIDYDGDPSLDLGDKIKLTGNTAEKTGTYSYIMISSFTYKQKQSIKSVGANPLLARAKSKTDKKFDNTTTEIEASKIKIIKYRSSNPYDITAERQKICDMSITASSEDTVQFTSQILFRGTSPGLLEFEYELNGKIVDFSPKQIITYNGEYIITLFWPITGLLSGTTNSWKVFLKASQNAAGSINNGDIVATIMGTNATEGPKFDGYITIEEKMKFIEYGGISLFNMTDNVNVEQSVPPEPLPENRLINPYLTSNTSSTQGTPTFETSGQYHGSYNNTKLYQLYDGILKPNWDGNSTNGITVRGNQGDRTHKIGFIFNENVQITKVEITPSIKPPYAVYGPASVQVQYSNNKGFWENATEVISTNEASSGTITIKGFNIQTKNVRVKLTTTKEWFGISEVKWFGKASEKPPEPGAIVIPKGGTYYRGVNTNTVGDFSDASQVLQAGDYFPGTPLDGDVYINKTLDYYEYRYNKQAGNPSSNWEPTNEGWGVACNLNGQTEEKLKNPPNTILEKIGKNPLRNTHFMFLFNKSIQTPPSIPNTVKNCYGTFWGSSITTASNIPTSAERIDGIFYACNGLKGENKNVPLVIPKTVINMSSFMGSYFAQERVPFTGNITINTDTTQYSGMFNGTTGKITIDGTSKNLATIANQYPNVNIKK